MKARKINNKDVMLGLIAQALISGLLDLLKIMSISGGQQIIVAALLILIYVFVTKDQEKQKNDDE